MVDHLRQLKQDLAKEISPDMSITEAREKGLCIHCHLPAAPRCSTPAGQREYLISTLCEVCFDEITKETDE